MTKIISIINDNQSNTLLRIANILEGFKKRIVLIDSGRYCRLTSLMEAEGILPKGSLEESYVKENNMLSKRNFKDYFNILFEHIPTSTTPRCIPLGSNERLFLLPGHPNLRDMSYAFDCTRRGHNPLMGDQQLLKRIADEYTPDYILINVDFDDSPIGDFLKMGSDYFYFLVEDDCFSWMKLEHISQTFLGLYNYMKLTNNPNLFEENNRDRYIETKLKCLGVDVLQKKDNYYYSNKIAETFDNTLTPSLEEVNAITEDFKMNIFPVESAFDIKILERFLTLGE